MDVQVSSVQMDVLRSLTISFNQFCSRDSDVVGCSNSSFTMEFQYDANIQFPFEWLALGMVGGMNFEMRSAEKRGRMQSGLVLRDVGLANFLKNQSIQEMVCSAKRATRAIESDNWQSRIRTVEGHPGTTLEKVDNPDKIEVLKVDQSKLPKGVYKEIGSPKRQGAS